MKKIKLAAIFVFILWVVSQILVIIFFHDVKQPNDSLSNYIPHALQHCNIGNLYPTKENLYDLYIQSCGYVNFLALLFRILGPTFIGVMFVNLLMNICIVVDIYYLSKRFFSENIACISVILYCLILSNVFVHLYLSSDLASLFFALTGFVLALNRRWYIIILGSLFLGITHTIRPYEIAFVLPVLIYMWKNKVKWSHYIYLIIPYLFVILMMGYYSKNQTGSFITCSSTSNYGNLKIALGDGKNDAGNEIFFEKNNPKYIGTFKGYTFAQKDSIWGEMAKPGLKKNAIKYMLYWPKRILTLYKVDSWSIPSLFEADKPEVKDKAKDKKRAKLEFLFLHTMYSLNYYIIFALFFVSLIINKKSILSEKGLFLLALVIMTCGFSISIAEDRYHYPCVFLLCIWAAYGVDTMLKKRKEKSLLNLK